ncbi:hypothetical protein [Ekhidna sp.]
MRAAFITLFFIAIGAHPTVSADQLSDQDLNEIKKRAEELKNKTAYELRIEYGSVNQIDSNEPTIVLTLDFQKKEGRIRANMPGKILNADYFQRLEYLYISKGFESNTLKESIMYMIEDIERSHADEIMLNKKVPLEHDPDEFSQEFFNVLFFFLFVGFVYVVKSAHKMTQGTNKAEYWQYYGHSRMTQIQKISVGTLVIAPIVVFIFQYVFFYDEVVLLYGCLVLVSRPLVLFGSHIFKLINDTRASKKIDFVKHYHLSLGQKMYLMKPSLQTEEYLLLDIYELLISKKLIVTAELKEPAHLNRYRNFLSRNLALENQQVSSFQQMILDIFPTDREEYYLVHPLINKVMGELMSFKHYKKDFLILDLVKQGFVTAKSWSYNKFSFTPSGKEYQKKLERNIKNLRIMVDGYIHGSSELDVSKLDGSVLLMIEAEKKIDNLYEKLLNDYKLEEARQSNIGVIMEPSFSFYQYRMAVRNKITEVYESRIGSADWSEGL